MNDLKFSTKFTSDGTPVYYNEADNVKGSEGLVFFDGRWHPCPTHELMYPQATDGHPVMGNRVLVKCPAWSRNKLWKRGRKATVLSSYHIGKVQRVCVQYEDRLYATDTDGIPVNTGAYTVSVVK